MTQFYLCRKLDIIFKNISKLLKPIETKVITNEQINHINDLLDVIIESKEQCKK